VFKDYFLTDDRPLGFLRTQEINPSCYCTLIVILFLVKLKVSFYYTKQDLKLCNEGYPRRIKNFKKSHEKKVATRVALKRKKKGSGISSFGMMPLFPNFIKFVQICFQYILCMVV
jgi:hypothetical protein